jgi:hypothetical protein
MLTAETTIGIVAIEATTDTAITGMIVDGKRIGSITTAGIETEIMIGTTAGAIDGMTIDSATKAIGFVMRSRRWC